MKESSGERPDCLLEGNGFELPVPPDIGSGFRLLMLPPSPKVVSNTSSGRKFARLPAGGEWIRTSGTPAREVGCRAPKNRAGRIAAAQLADLVLVRCRSAGTLALAPGRCPGAARRPGVGGFGDGGWALAHARTGAAGF